MRTLQQNLSTRRASVILFAAWLFAVGFCAARLDAAEFFLRDGQRVVFFGDSITQNGTYVVYIDAYLRTRFPDKRFDIVNHGISSETVSGTSEPDHDPPRPHALKRYERDVAAWKPDVLVSCFGMNDGNYYPFDRERFEKYQAGYRTLIDWAAKTGCRLVIATPPPFDPYRRQVSDPRSLTFGYKFPAVDYDGVLDRYSRWLLDVDEENVSVVDLHEPMNEHLNRRRETLASFHFSPDAVHPNETGHWLMAQQLLLAWNAPAEVAVLRVDAERERAEGEKMADVSVVGDSISITWTAPIPMPMDPAWDAESIALEDVSRRLNDYRLVVTGLTAAKYEMSVDGVSLGKFNRKQLTEGIDLAQLEKFPPTDQARQVLELVKRRHRLIYDDWRRRIAAGENGQAAADHPEAADIEAQLRDLCQPRAVCITLAPESE
jgi:lysophospholipase L1-like esterase